MRVFSLVLVAVCYASFLKFPLAKASHRKPKFPLFFSSYLDEEEGVLYIGFSRFFAAYCCNDHEKLLISKKEKDINYVSISESNNTTIFLNIFIPLEDFGIIYLCIKDPTCLFQAKNLQEFFSHPLQLFWVALRRMEDLVEFCSNYKFKKIRAFNNETNSMESLNFRNFEANKLCDHLNYGKANISTKKFRVTMNNIKIENVAFFTLQCSILTDMSSSGWNINFVCFPISKFSDISSFWKAFESKQCGWDCASNIEILQRPFLIFEWRKQYKSPTLINDLERQNLASGSNSALEQSDEQKCGRKAKRPKLHDLSSKFPPKNTSRLHKSPQKISTRRFPHHLKFVNTANAFVQVPSKDVACSSSQDVGLLAAFVPKASTSNSFTPISIDNTFVSQENFVLFLLFVIKRVHPQLNIEMICISTVKDIFALFVTILNEFFPGQIKRNIISVYSTTKYQIYRSMRNAFDVIEGNFMYHSRLLCIYMHANCMFVDIPLNKHKIIYFDRKIEMDFSIVVDEKHTSISINIYSGSDDKQQFPSNAMKQISIFQDIVSARLALTTNEELSEEFVQKVYNDELNEYIKSTNTLFKLPEQDPMLMFLFDQNQKILFEMTQRSKFSSSTLYLEIIEEATNNIRNQKQQDCKNFLIVMMTCVWFDANFDFVQRWIINEEDSQNKARLDLLFKYMCMYSDGLNIVACRNNIIINLQTMKKNENILTIMPICLFVFFFLKNDMAFIKQMSSVLKEIAKVNFQKLEINLKEYNFVGTVHNRIPCAKIEQSTKQSKPSFLAKKSIKDMTTWYGKDTHSDQRKPQTEKEFDALYGFDFIVTLENCKIFVQELFFVEFVTSPNFDWAVNAILSVETTVLRIENPAEFAHNVVCAFLCYDNDKRIKKMSLPLKNLEKFTNIAFDALRDIVKGKIKSPFFINLVLQYLLNYVQLSKIENTSIPINAEDLANLTGKINTHQFLGLILKFNRNFCFDLPFELDAFIFKIHLLMNGSTQRPTGFNINNLRNSSYFNVLSESYKKKFFEKLNREQAKKQTPKSAKFFQK